MDFAGCSGCAKKGIGRGKGFVGQAMLQPNLAKLPVLPVGKQTDAVGRAKNRVKIFSYLGKGQVEVNNLRHVKGGLHVEGDLGDDAQRTETNNGGVKAVVVAGQGKQVAVGGEELEGRNGRC